jgi:hypothetical protein
MYRFWDTIIEPVLKRLRPKTIVEIGSDHGPNTRNLLKFCQRHGGTLHVIDPGPKYDTSDWKEEYGEQFVFHKALSLEALPLIDRFDTVLIDGDHNWYTVFKELELIEQRCADSSRHFPLVMLHDIGWPYGRRDGYYNPDTIPEEYRQPYAQSGMRPESEELVGPRGINRNLANSVSENVPQNGVLTAVEDFLKETEQDIEFLQIPGLFGLGILVPLRLREHNAELANFLDIFKLPPTVARYIELIEQARLEAEIDGHERGLKAKEIRQRMNKKVSNLERKIADREQQKEALQSQLQEIQNSFSWQLLNSFGRIRARVLGGDKTQ